VALQFDVPVASDIVRKALQFATPYLGSWI
jgi:hypothetical protein